MTRKGALETRLPQVFSKEQQSNDYSSFILETCVLENDNSLWIIDFGSTNHVCNSLQLLESWEEVNEGCLKLKVGNIVFVTVQARGRARLKFGNKFLILNDVFFILNFSRNLIPAHVAIRKICYDFHKS